MAFYVSPGVYVQERDLSEIIPNIATTIAGLVGYSAKGNVDELQLITNSRQFIEEYGEPDPTTGYFHHTALAFLEKGNKLYCMRVHKSALYGGVKIMQSGEGPNIAISSGASSPVYADVSGEDIAFYVFAKDPGVWNNTLGVKITNVDAVNYEFTIEVYQEDDDGNDIKVETWDVSRKTKVDGYGRQMYLEDRINDYSSYIVVADNTGAADTVMPEAQATVLNLAQGSDGTTVTDSEVVAGWDKFTNPDDVDVRILLNGGYTSVTVQQKIKTVAEARLDCIGVLDMPYSETTSVSSMITWRETTQNFNTSYTALYSGWVRVYDRFNDRVLYVPPSGYVGAQYAYNDFVAEPWYAPAGFNRGILNVLGVSNVFTQGERDLLYPAGINPVQMFRGEGIVLWGQKTQQTKASALDRVNVRRLLITLEKSISAALRYYCFELNNELTRFRVKSTVESYLDLLGARGAFQTEAGDNGYRVVCDTTNNTAAVIDRNELKVDILLKPARAAEAIELKTVITQSGASFDELIARGANL